MGNRRRILASELDTMTLFKKKKQQFLICHTPSSFATLSHFFATYALQMDIFQLQRLCDKYPIQAVRTQLFSGYLREKGRTKPIF